MQTMEGNMRIMYFLGKTIALATLVLPLTATVVDAKPSDKNQQIIDHWTPTRIKQAIPRQLVIASNGLGYLRMPDGSLQPHGHNKLVEVTKISKQPQAKPGTGGGDNEGPSISPIEPSDGATVGGSQRFAATITDASGVRSVSLVITFPDNSSQSFSMTNSSGDVWGNTISGFTTSDGWSWRMTAKDATKGKGNVTTSDSYAFNVDVSGEPPPPPGDGVVTNDYWPEFDNDFIRESVGRIYFEMPTNRRLKRWAGYVCSGTVAIDDTGNRTVIITAAHCAYDDANKAFARNVLFIPNQDGTTGSGTDSNCSNDPLGCWTPSFSVVDTNWTTSTFPDNIPWDYAYYVVSDSGAHSGNGSGGSLDGVVGGLSISFAAPFVDDGSTSAEPDYTHGIGYSYSEDPNLMYCAENMTTEGDYNWWLPNCGLSGGSSGGPWVQPMTGGDGPIISVNSWGYTGSPGMAGPLLYGTSAACLFDGARGTAFDAVSDAHGQQGIDVTCP
jgi:hypothetical protein